MFRTKAMILRLGLALVAPALLFPASTFGGEALTTNQPGDSLSFVDLATMKTVAEIKIGGKPAGIALSPDKTLAYITAPDSQELIEVDAAARTVKRRLKIGGGPLGIAAHPSRPEVYVADWYAHKMSVVGTATLTVIAEIPVGQSPSGLAVTADGKLLLSADRDSDQVSFVDLGTRAAVATVAAGKRPFGVTIDAAGQTAFIANVASDEVSVIDIASRKLTATIKTGHRPYAVALAAGRGFVTGQYSGTIDVFEVATGQPVKAIDACDHPEGIEADTTGNYIYAACWGDNIILKIDAHSLQIMAKAAVGDGPRAFGKFLR